MDANESVQTATITTTGLATLSDGEHTFFSITDGRGNTDYLYREGDGTSDFEEFLLTGYNDIFSGSDEYNYVQGWGGNDTIYGQGGNDNLHGSTGLDTIYGGDGNDSVYGDEEQDTLF